MFAYGYDVAEDRRIRSIELMSNLIVHPPAPGDDPEWRRLIAEHDADGRVIVELHHPVGFNCIDVKLPASSVIFVSVPANRLEHFVFHNEIYGPIWVVD